MTDKESKIKSRLKLLINNIDEFDSKFVTYKAESMKSLLKDTLEYINNKEQECEELRGRLNTTCFDPRANNNRCISYNRMAEDYEKDLKKLLKYKTLFLKERKIYQRSSKYNQQLIDENEDLKDTIKRFTCQSECYKHKDAEKYKQALDEIENYVRDNSDFDKNDKLTSNTGAYDILEIINKAKAVSNAR